MLRLGQHSLIPLHFDQLSDREVFEMARWIRSNVRQVDHGERPLKWIRLKQKLKAFDCTSEPAPGVGNRLNISRAVTIQGRFRQKREYLHVQVACAGDGTDADRNTVHEVRKQLHLDNAHGVDSIAFYDGALIDQFIIDYHSLLQRLGKF